MQSSQYTYGHSTTTGTTLHTSLPCMCRVHVRSSQRPAAADLQARTDDITQHRNTREAVCLQESRTEQTFGKGSQVLPHLVFRVLVVYGLMHLGKLLQLLQ